VELLFALRNLGAEPVFNKHRRKATRSIDLSDLLIRLVVQKKVNVADLLEHLRPMMPPRDPATININDVEAVNAFARKAARSPRFIPNEAGKVEGELSVLTKA
jgi:hypothetical protein